MRVPLSNTAERIFLAFLMQIGMEGNPSSGENLSKDVEFAVRDSSKRLSYILQASLAR
jgi:hypothetical protein